MAVADIYSVTLLIVRGLPALQILPQAYREYPPSYHSEYRESSGAYSRLPLSPPHRSRNPDFS